MTPERWQRVKELFEEACDLDAVGRSEFLKRACTDDEEVRREVESLLRVHDQDTNFMNTPAGDLLTGDMPLLRTGQRFGYYEQIAALGKGGMGQVYSAVDSRLGRKIALKLLPSSLTHQADRVRRFEQEARAASALNHPNIVTIHEIGEIDSLQFIATEFVDGETLREHATNRALTIAQAVEIGSQIASALQAAHEAGIVHRDIKPENIMLRRDGIVKVLDFGLAKLARDQVAVQSQAPTRPMVSTSPGVVMGTIGYMSPEQARGADVDARTDIWSLGVVLYEMVSGRAPFVGETPSHIIVSIIEHEPPPLPVSAKVPKELQRIVTTALTKDREQRYQSVGNLLADLKRLKQKLELNAAINQAAEPEEHRVDDAATRIQQRVARTDDVALARTAPRIARFVKSVRTTKPAWAIVGAFLLLMIIVFFGVWRFSLRSDGTPVRSIAVLPFQNQTNNPDSDYLSDGISETLINHLSQLPGMKVSARSSSFRYKDPTADLKEVANALGVDAVLTGRVSQRGDNFVINVELMDARDKTQIWGEQYNRKVADLLIVQSDISTEIVRRLSLQLSPAQQQQVAKRDSVNLQAYELYLKGRFTWEADGTDNRKKAVELYQQAIAVDPAYALAYAQLSLSYNGLITNNEIDPKEFTAKAAEAARKAVELDDNVAESHLAMAWAKMSAWDWASAEQELKRTLELNPNLPGGHLAYASFLRAHGKVEEVIAQFKYVRDVDPMSVSPDQAALAELSMFRKNDQGLELAKKILEANPLRPGAHLRVGEFYARVGRYQEAITAYEQAIKMGDASADAQTMLADAYARAGETDKARGILQRYESGKEYCSPVALAIIHLGLGDRDQAFAALEAAYAAHDQQLIWLRGAWQFDELHDDPRFQDLARRIGVLS